MKKQIVSSRILIIEDMPKNLQLIGTILKKENYLVSMASNAKDALVSIERELPDLILSDIMLPGMNGFVFCEKLKSIETYKNIPIIFLSGLTDKLNKVHGFSIGASDYITKPIEKDELLARVKTHLTIRKLSKELEETNIDLERKVSERTKELLLAKDKAEESERVKTAFLASISHELRTPLNSIIGFSDLILNDIISQNPIEYVKNINTSGLQLLEIIEGIFSMALLETGETVINHNEFILNDVMDDIRNQISLEHQSRNNPNLQVFYQELVGEKLIVLRTDKFKLKQILLILINNALKFTNEGSVNYGFVLNPENLCFYVKDTGIGIPEKDNQIIFDRFRQLDQTDSKLYGGLGVGLSIAKQLSEILEFELNFESKLNQGSTFYLNIPRSLISKLTEHPSETISDTPTLFVGKRFLIAEDEHANFLFLKTTLELYGAEIIKATDGKQAIEMTKSHQPDLILMDLRMPVMNGFDAITEIKSFAPEIPIIIQSAYSLPVLFSQKYKNEKVYHLAKPIIREELILALKKYLIPHE
ncbi:MAG: response regulator [Bacteroidales bacterium]|nr:response regulator [Bacteroidales bacterium]